jgi:hypothetical protein
VKELLKQKRITVIYDPEFKLLKDRANQLSTEEKLVVHYPSYLNTGLDEGKKLLKEMVPMLKALDAL